MPFTIPADKRPIQFIWTGPNYPTAPSIDSIKADPYPGGNFHSVLQHLRDHPALTPDPRGARFVIHHPASWLPSPNDHNSNQFHTLTTERRDAYHFAIKEALRQTDRPFTLGISTHIISNTPFNMARPYHWQTPTNPQHMADYWGGCICPWVQLSEVPIYEWGMEGGNVTAGVAGEPPGEFFGMGGLPIGTTPWDASLLWQQFLNTKGIKTMTEAIPLQGSPLVADMARLNQMACWCLYDDFLLAGFWSGTAVGAPEAHAVRSSFAHSANYTGANMLDIQTRGCRVALDYWSPAGTGLDTNLQVYEATFGPGGQP